MSKGKKIALIVSMVAVLVVAAVLNVTLLATKDKNNGETTRYKRAFSKRRVLTDKLLAITKLPS